MLSILVSRDFSSVSRMKKWLLDKMEDFDNPDDFYKWLYDHIAEGNEFVVHGETWDYASLCELL